MRLFISVLVSWTLLGDVGQCSLSSHAVYLGCHSVSTTQQQPYHRIINPFVAEDCLKLCSGNGHHYAGLDSGKTLCYCGKELLTNTIKTEGTFCKPCIEDNNVFCGGASSISLYQVPSDSVNVNITTVHEDIAGKFEEDEPMILLAGHGGIYAYNKSHVLRTVIEVDYPVVALDYDIRRKVGFAIWNEVMYRFPLFEDKPLREHEAEHIWEVNRCPTFAVDWVHEKLYWPDCYQHYIRVYDLNKEYYDQIVLVSLSNEGAWALDMVIDPYAGLLFWTSGPSLWRLTLDGRGLRKIVPEFPVNRVSSISLELANERIYFTGLDKHDNKSSKLYFSDFQGALSHSLQFSEYEGGSHILSFGMFNHMIYYIKSLPGNTSTVAATKLDYIHKPNTIIHEIQVTLLRLVHPKLQTPLRVDACTNYGCSHVCWLEEEDLPRCHCPRHHLLDHDNRTCEANYEEDDEEPLVVRAALGAIMVLMVLIGAGALMCICDKIWSQLHPTVVTLGMPGAARSFTGNRRLDGENLI